MLVIIACYFKVVHWPAFLKPFKKKKSEEKNL